MKTFDISAKEKLEDALEVINKIVKYHELITVYINDPKDTIEKLKNIYVVEGDVYEDILKGLISISTRPKAVELGKQLIVSQLISLAEHFKHEYIEYLEIPYKMTEDIKVNIDTLKNANIFLSLDDMVKRFSEDDVRKERLGLVVKDLLLKEFGVEISYEKEPDVYLKNLIEYYNTIKYESIADTEKAVDSVISYKLKEDKECYELIATSSQDNVSKCNVEYLKELNDADDVAVVVEPNKVHIMHYEAATGVGSVYNKECKEPFKSRPLSTDIITDPKLTTFITADLFKTVYETLKERMDIEDKVNNEFNKAFKPLVDVKVIDESLSYYIEMVKRYYNNEIDAEWFNEASPLYTNIAVSNLANISHMVSLFINMLNTLNDEVTVTNQVYDVFVKIITEANIGK